ncbi:tRNA(Ile)(2)-agmatinylcytidine synthase [Methanothermococcus sp. SCGC AD-155-C09]|nr:tRNA(Ile)(2)-agmatinylcytidine synthase [Methanothermococcus sp. SCGC AD-155-C09]
MFIGIDDTDSKDRYCTTYIGTLLMEELGKKYLLDTPKLIRMNPMVKYKTRGNGGISLRIIEKDKLKDKDIEYIKKIVIKYVEEYSDFENENTNPGIVFLRDEDYKKNRDILRKYYKKVLYDIVDVEYAKKTIKNINGEYIGYKKELGIIGALGSIASNGPYTYELLTYRKRENWGKERIIDNKSVVEMDKKTFPLTFNNVDGDKQVIAPRTKCPVLYGIRGLEKDVLLKAMKMVVCGEEIDRYTIFKTNQGTDAHLRPLNIGDIYPNTGVIVYGWVVEEPKDIIGGTVIFKLKDSTGEIDCIAYEPTKEFRNIVRKLKEGDAIGVYGTVREEPLGINIEKMKVLKLNKKYIKNKVCSCGGTLKSKGVKSGYKCNKCGKRVGYNDIKLIEVKRDLLEGFYEVPVSARRHLSKPLILF